MSNIATMISQSRKLVELGLDPATSDMWWIDDQLVAKSDKFYTPSNDEETTVHCAWSLAALLKVMPKNTNETYHLFSSMMADQLGSWVCDRSKYYMSANGHNKNDYECFKSDNPITAAYEMVCWLLEQGMIKKGGEHGRD